MAHGEQGKSTRVNHDLIKARKFTVPISIKDLMEKEVQLYLEDRAMREMSVLADPENEDSTKIKKNICILDHPKNLIEVLHARLAIGQVITGNNITTGLRQYRFTRTFPAGEALHIFDLKSTELRHKTIASLTIVINHVVAYFGTKVCLSKQKCYICYKMEKPRKKPQGYAYLSRFQSINRRSGYLRITLQTSRNYGQHRRGEVCCFRRGQKHQEEEKAP